MDILSFSRRFPDDDRVQLVSNVQVQKLERCGGAYHSNRSK